MQEAPRAQRASPSLKDTRTERDVWDADSTGRGACSDQWSLRHPPPCSSVGLLTDVKAPRFVLCLTHRFRRTADNKITWECPLYSKSGAEFLRKLCKKELPTISCVWESTHVGAFRHSKVKKCYIKHLPDSAVSYFNCLCICIKSMHHTKL